MNLVYYSVVHSKAIPSEMLEHILITLVGPMVDVDQGLKDIRLQVKILTEFFQYLGFVVVDGEGVNLGFDFGVDFPDEFGAFEQFFFEFVGVGMCPGNDTLIEML